MHSHPTRSPRISASPTPPAIDSCAPRRGRSDLLVWGIVLWRGFIRIAILYARVYRQEHIESTRQSEERVSCSRRLRTDTSLLDAHFICYQSSLYCEFGHGARSRGVRMRSCDLSSAAGDARGNRAVGPCREAARLRDAGVAP